MEPVHKKATLYTQNAELSQSVTDVLAGSGRVPRAGRALLGGGGGGAARRGVARSGGEAARSWARRGGDGQGTNN